MRWIPCIFFLIFFLAADRIYAVTCHPNCPETLSNNIISLSPNIDEMLDELGLSPIVTGVTQFSPLLKNNEKLKNLGGWINPNIEQILLLKPQAVLVVDTGLSPQVIRTLRELSVTVIVFKSDTIDIIFEEIIFLGKIFQKTKKAEMITQKIRNQISDIQKKTTGLLHPKILVVFDKKPIIGAGKKNFIHEMIQIAGGQNVLEKKEIPYPVVSLEELYELDPNFIIDLSMGDNSTQKSQIISLWELGKLNIHSEVVVLPVDLMTRPGPYIGKAIETLFHTIHTIP